MATSGSFVGLKGENCTLMNIRGVKVLEDENGIDLLKLVKKGLTKHSDIDVESTVANLLLRIDALEKFVKNMPVGGSGAAGPAGPAGKNGEAGEKGETGPQGPRGKDGAKSMAELKDVCLDGLDDNALLSYSEKDKKWVVLIE